MRLLCGVRSIVQEDLNNVIPANFGVRALEIKITGGSTPVPLAQK
jgi:hypothetical protein